MELVIIGGSHRAKTTSTPPSATITYRNLLLLVVARQLWPVPINHWALEPLKTWRVCIGGIPEILAVEMVKRCLGKQ